MDRDALSDSTISGAAQQILLVFGRKMVEVEELYLGGYGLVAVLNRQHGQV